MNSSKLFSLLIISGICLSIYSCDNAAQKVVKAEENVVDAEKDLQMAQEEYLADVKEYRLISAEKIAANDKSIADFNARIDKEKKTVSADYRAKINELEQKNSDMKKKMDDYQDNGKEKWDIFKAEFGRDMDALGESISNFGKNDK